MLGSVPTTHKSLQDYRPIVGDQKIEEILDLARDLRGARVLHVNATAFGGGVAEILGTLVPLMKDIGLDVDWQVIRGSDEFFNVTKAMHNSLQGMYIPWSAEMYDIWRKYNALNAEAFDEKYDFVVIHDPQPAGMLQMIRQRNKNLAKGRWIWRCHIDVTNAQPDLWDFLRHYINEYDAAIFTMPDYVKQDLAVPVVAIIPPAIDPLSPKNADMAVETIYDIMREYKVDINQPMICQVSRFDPWKDPLGVIDVYRMVKQSVPDLQLVMVASMASDDPEGWSYFERTARRAGEDEDIHLLSNLNGVGNVEVNAFQRAAMVVLQKSIREGFGLVVSEALWKGRPVVAGNVGGIPLQIENGKDGYLIDTTDDCAERVLELLQNPKESTEMGERGREHVRENFLITRNLRDYLRLFHKVKNGVKAPTVMSAFIRAE